MMAEKTPEYQLRAAKKYHAKFREMRFRVLPEEQELIIAHAKEAGDKSTSAFIIRAIREAMERDKAVAENRQNK